MMDKKEILIIILKLLAFLVCVALVIVGQRFIGIPGTLTQISGIAGILLLLWNYNRKFND